MFTIRISWGDKVTMPLYTVYAADKYGVSNDPDNQGCLLLVLELNNEDRHVILGPGTRVYVMNDRGSTIDTIIA